MNILTRLKSAVRAGRYELTEHAIEEAEDDGFAPLDIRNAILNGELRTRYARDPRGTRYLIVGPALDGRIMCIVCRFTELKHLRVVTVFADPNEE